MGNIPRMKKYKNGLNNETLETYQVKIDLIWNLRDKCTIWYPHQNS